MTLTVLFERRYFGLRDVGDIDIGKSAIGPALSPRDCVIGLTQAGRHGAVLHANESEMFVHWQITALLDYCNSLYSVRQLGRL